MRQRQAELLKDFEDEKQTTFAITADMTRQYKSMQEELMRRINTLESTIMEQKDQLELARQSARARVQSYRLYVIKQRTLTQIPAPRRQGPSQTKPRS